MSGTMSLIIIIYERVSDSAWRVEGFHFHGVSKALVRTTYITNLNCCLLFGTCWSGLGVMGAI